MTERTPPFPEPVHDRASRPETLLAVDRLLDLGIKILDADAGAGQTDRCQRIEAVVVDVIGIDLDGDGCILRKAELGAQRVHEPPQVVRNKHCGRAAAEMDRPDHTPRSALSRQRDLGMERRQIFGHRLVAERVLGVAGAEPAQPVAERYVEIERQRIAIRNRREPAFDDLGSDIGGEVRRGRIARIARSGFAQARRQVGVHSENPLFCRPKRAGRAHWR